MADGLKVPEADLTQAVLRQGGIDSQLRDFHMVWMNWHLMDALGGVKVQVAGRDLPAAWGLLNQPPEAFPALEVDADPPPDEASVTLDGSPPCPCCGSAADPLPDPEPQGFLVEWVKSLVPLPIPYPRWICKACGKRWIESGTVLAERPGSEAAEARRPRHRAFRPSSAQARSSMS